MTDTASIKVSRVLLHKALYKISVYEKERDFDTMLQAIGLIEDSIKCLKGNFNSEKPFDTTVNNNGEYTNINDF